MQPNVTIKDDRFTLCTTYLNHLARRAQPTIVTQVASITARVDSAR